MLKRRECFKVYAGGEISALTLIYVISWVITPSLLPIIR